MDNLGNRPIFYNTSAHLKASKSGTETFNSDKAKQYYSSLDVEIYFGDHYIDEILHLEYQVQQNTLPIFGYNSFIFDKAVQGTRLIQGSFTINFTEADYLFKLVEELKAMYNIKPETEELNYYNFQDSNLWLKYLEEQKIIEKRKNDRNKNPLWGTLFDIDIMFGQEPNTSSTLLTGIVLTGAAQQFDTSGVPITERYTFMGRDIRSDL